MKKTKSSASLANLALSIKKSINLPNQPLTSSLINHTPPTPKTSEKIAKLHEQIEHVEKMLANNEYSKKKVTMRNYEQQLARYDEIVKSIAGAEIDVEQWQDHLVGLRNREAMLKEDYLSSQTNLEDALAEIEYYQQIIGQYRQQYDAESVVFLRMLSLQQQISNLKKGMEKLEIDIDDKERSLIEWKQQTGFDLAQKISKQKLTQLRMDLMRVEDLCNQHAQQNNLLKFREILCMYLKQYSSQNCQPISHHEIAEGMEIYICREMRVQDYQLSVVNYRNKLNNKHSTHLIQQYFSILKKMESVLSNSRHNQDQKINQQYRNEIENMRKKLIKKEEEISVKGSQLQVLQKKLQAVLADHSVAVIEHLRENCGRYELKDIKQKLKVLKKEQKQRTQQIAHASYRLEQLSSRPTSVNTISYMNELNALVEEIKNGKGQLRCKQNMLKELNGEKQQIEELMSVGISKWKQAQAKKQELRELYRQLHQASKKISSIDQQMKQTKLEQFKQKTIKTISKTRKESQSTNNLRQTLKMRIERGNKENLPRNLGEDQKKYPNIELTCQLSCTETRKPSLSRTTGRSSKAFTVREGTKNRSSLSQMLLSRLTK